MSAGAGPIAAVCEPGGDAAGTLAAAGALARAGGAGPGTGLLALAVVEPPSELARLAAAAGLAEETAVERLAAEARERLEALVKTVPDPAPTVEVRIGKPFLEIVRLALAHDLDFVVKTVERGMALLASTDQHLLRKCPCPVWLRRPGDPPLPRRIVAAIDAGETAQAGLNGRILATAARLAVLGGAPVPVHAVHAWEAPGEAMVRRWAAGPDGLTAAEGYTRAVRERHESALRAAIADAVEAAGGAMGGIAPPEAVLVNGPAREAVPAAVERLDADLLVMGTIARTGVPGLIIGNTAEDILNAVACPIVTVKPPGYETPVR